jgi:DNA processing protein
MIMDDIVYWLALKAVRGVGNLLFFRLIERFGSPENVFKAPKAALLAVEGVGQTLASSIIGHEPTEEVIDDLKRVQEQGGYVVTFSDSSYPMLLREIYDPPPFLYVLGNLRPDSVNIAVVGSRNATSYGRSVTLRLSGDLATRGITIVSGMARGIDSAAHKGALSAGGETIAVLGCGLGTVYPAENKKLFERIQKNGAVVSEFPFFAEPEAHHFPARNRIISGLSVGTVIVEATQKSGSLITAKLAADQGREVYAVPGSITSFKSTGTHSLIKQGAKLVEQANDIMEELNLDSQKSHATPKQGPLVKMTPEEEKVFHRLSPYPIHIDDLSRQLALSSGELSSLLLNLELKGLANQSPGKLFTRADIH